MLIKIARSLYRERERGGDKKVKTLLISVVLYPEAAAPPYAATDRGREYLKANDEGRGREISEAFGLAECEIVSGEKDFGDWHSCVARI